MVFRRSVIALFLSYNMKEHTLTLPRSVLVYRTLCLCLHPLFYGVLWILQKKPICTNRELILMIRSLQIIESEMESAVQLKLMVVVMCSPMYTVLQ